MLTLKQWIILGLSHGRIVLNFSDEFYINIMFDTIDIFKRPHLSQKLRYWLVQLWRGYMINLLCYISYMLSIYYCVVINKNALIIPVGSKQMHNIRKKMSTEKVRLRDRCLQYNRFLTVVEGRGTSTIPTTMIDEEEPIWPWIDGSTGTQYNDCTTFGCNKWLMSWLMYAEAYRIKKNLIYKS